MDKTLRKLKVWAGSRLLLDASWLPDEIELLDGVGVLGYAIAAAARTGVESMPVVRLNDAEPAHRDARLHVESGNEIAVRLNVEDMDEDPEDLEEAALLRRLAAHPRRSTSCSTWGVDGEVAVRAAGP